MNGKQRIETALVERFLQDRGSTRFHLTAGDKPDVIAQFGSKRIGIEVTQFHADEQPDARGSGLREEEERNARNAPGRAQSHFVRTNPLPALAGRIREKIATCAKYDHSRYEELWLLVSSQVPSPGSLAATFAIPLCIAVARLNEATHKKLAQSVFSAVHFHLMGNHYVFSWCRKAGWCQAR